MILSQVQLSTAANFLPGDNIPSTGQKTIIQENSPADSVATFVEVMPEFPGGAAEMYLFLANNIKYPDIAKLLGISGSVIVRFVVDETGNITNAELLKGIGGGCDEESLRVINSMPAWKPGMQDGKPVKVYYTMPIIFKLTGKAKKK